MVGTSSWIRACSWLTMVHDIQKLVEKCFFFNLLPVRYS